MNELVKTVKVFGQESAWDSNSNDTTTIAFRLFKDEAISKISFEKISGPDIDIQSLINIICYDFDILKSITNYIVDYKRVNSFIVNKREGQSGCIDLTLITSRNKFSVAKNGYKRARLHISCFNKVDVNEIQDMWIGDMIELLMSYDEDIWYQLKDSVIENSKKGLAKMRKGLFTYIKTEKPRQKIDISEFLNTEELYEKQEFILTTRPGFFTYDDDGYMRTRDELDAKGVEIFRLDNYDFSFGHQYCVKFNDTFYKIYTMGAEYSVEKVEGEEIPYPFNKDDVYKVNTENHREVYLHLAKDNAINDYLHLRIKNNEMLEIAFVIIYDDGVVALYSNLYLIDKKGNLKNMTENRNYMNDTDKELGNTFNKDDIIK